VDAGDIAGMRLSSQLIALDSMARTPDEVLTSLGAVQAQDYPAALWAIGLRSGASKSDVEEAISDGRISRTWLMRGTIHFAASRDVHWMLDLFAPRLLNTAISRDRHLGLSDETIKDTQRLFAKALKGGKRLARDQMYQVLDKGGLKMERSLGYHILYRAAWDGVICFGPNEGKQPTFELLDERVAGRKALSNEEALACLASRYFTSHGPATLKDYLWWSGLRTSDAKKGIEGASGELASEVVDGKTFYMSKARKLGRVDNRVHLLPAFDEYLVGYADRSAALSNADTQRMLTSGKVFFTHSNGIFLPVIVADGEVVGTWKRKVAKEDVSVSIRPFTKLGEDIVDGVHQAAGRYAKFLDTAVATSFERLG